MSFDSFIALAGFDRAAAARLLPCWNAADADNAAAPEFLRPAFIQRYYPLTGGPDDLAAELEAVAAAIAAQPALAAYAWTLHHALYRAPLPPQGGGWPPVAALGERAGLLHLLIAMSAIPLIEATMNRLGLGEAQARANTAWIGGAIGLHQAGYGRPGVAFRQLAWLRHSVNGRLFRLGRFEYLAHPLPEHYPAVYRRRADGRVLALCRDGWTFDAEGWRVEEGAGVATARLREHKDGMEGMPISPRGPALIGRTVTLARDAWEPMATPWDLSPGVHIPAGGGMTPEAAGASLREARRFFAEKFGRAVRLFNCHSWLLNPDFERLLPQSNLAHFMRRVYLTPGTPPSGVEGLFFIFGRDDGDPANYPARTSLEKAFHQLRAEGRRLKSAGMIVSADLLDDFSENLYRDNHGPG